MKFIDRLLYMYSLIFSLMLLAGSILTGITIKNSVMIILLLPLPLILSYEGLHFHPIPLVRFHFKSLMNIKSPTFRLTLLLYAFIILFVVLKSINTTQTFASPAPLNP